MSNVISLINSIIGEPPKVCHSSYMDGGHNEVIVDAGIHKSKHDRFSYHLFYTIFNPAFMKQTGGFGYYHHGRGEFIENVDFCNLFRNEIQKIPTNLITIGCVNGNEQNILSITKNKFPNDFIYLGYDESILIDREPIPQKVALDIVDSISRGTQDFYNKIIEYFPHADNLILPPPPPINFDDEYVQIYNEGFKEDAKEYGLNPLSVRKKIHKLYTENLANKVNKSYKHVHFPTSFLDEFGAVPKKLAQGVTHGNVEFATIYFDQIEQEII